MTQLNAQTQQRPIRIGISACLLGHKVRFDGGHKQDRFLTDTLGQYFEWVPVCPEVEIGLGTPREAIRLVNRNDKVRLQTIPTQIDLTEKMRAYAKARAGQLDAEDLSGFILKKDSPSCGMDRVKVYPEQGPARRQGRGLFAESLLSRYPNLPVEEEGRLCDPKLRENWVERVFAYHALKGLWASRWTRKGLVEFHTHYKLSLMSHSEKEMRELGRLVARAKSIPRGEFRRRYEARFMSAMKKIATTKKHVNVLQHILGGFKKRLDDTSRHELLSHIVDYSNQLVPLVVPLTLIGHYVRVLNVNYLKDQVYLDPHPKQLALRNHV